MARLAAARPAAPGRCNLSERLSPPRSTIVVLDDDGDWPGLSAPVALAAVVFIAWLLLQASTGDHWVPVLDHANLAFHEAGHLLVGLVSERLAVYGGTIGQLVFPLAAAWQFHRRRHTLGFALCVAWAAESTLNIATYMADARALRLPLIGGLDPEFHHDWREIFSRWGMLHLDVAWATAVRGIAWGLGLLTCFWIMRRWLADRG